MAFPPVPPPTWVRFARGTAEAIVPASRLDPERNPEWNFVERESEVWLARS